MACELHPLAARSHVFSLEIYRGVPSPRVAWRGGAKPVAPSGKREHETQAAPNLEDLRPAVRAHGKRESNGENWLGT